MLPAPHRLRSSAAFARTIKRGRKKGSRTVVVYVLEPSIPKKLGKVSNPRIDSWGGPQMGLVVSKGVGNSVVRHNTARKIRAAFGSILDDRSGVDIESHHTIVIRALPNSATATTEEVEKDVRSCLRRIAKQRADTQ